MTFWAYMLHCRGGSFYTGHTDNLENRLAMHQAGIGSEFTANRLPVQLVWSQEFTSRTEALATERQIKGWSRAKKLALIRGDWAKVSELAKVRMVLRQAQDERIAGGNSEGRVQDERIARCSVA
jgi:predicted GIY-YIG superfamily endonuclease